MLIKTKIERNKSINVWTDLADRYQRLEDLISVDYCLMRCLKFQPKNEFFLLKKAELMEKLGKIKKSMIYYERLVSIDHHNIKVSKKLGYLYI